MIWALSGGGYFWPVWALFGWGIGLAFHAVAAYSPRATITEEQIRKEMDKISKA